MNTMTKWAMAVSFLSGAAYGQAPPGNDLSDGNLNTGMGSAALSNVNGGFANTASGYGSLAYDTTGGSNTAIGTDALFENITGNDNTASGYEALFNNRSGCDNTAAGGYALFRNETSCFNSAFGYQALFSNTFAYNTASGYQALYRNTSGGYNTASGAVALSNNTTGSYNIAVGLSALVSNTTGSNNVAVGSDADSNNPTGSNNIALGHAAGSNLTGSNNIDIGSDGVAADNGAIRIGTAGSQKEVFIAGIHTSKITGSAVYVAANGRLGVLASSERYKTAIVPMGRNSAKLGQLRPVTFKLKTDADGTVQYGLIAEEVAKVYPELVIRDEKGRIDGVRYDELAPMLLNEMQKEHVTVETLVVQHEEDSAKIASLERQLAGIQAALVKLQPKDELIAQR
jgi:hypothetical protein